MINIYIKASVIKGIPTIATIMESPKHRWVKSHKIKPEILPDNNFARKLAIESLCALFSLKHVKNKWKKKKVIVYSCSDHLISSMKKDKNGDFKNKTRIKEIDMLRDTIGTFNNINFKKFSDKCESLQELEHILIECALDDIEVDDKDLI